MSTLIPAQPAFSDRVSSRAASQFSSPSNASRQLLLFAGVANGNGGTPRSYAFPAEQIQQILQRPEITPVPLAREPFVGLAEWRNSIVPVVDLDRAMNGISDSNVSGLEPDRRSRLVIARRPGSHDVIGFLATASVKSLRLTETSLHLSPLAETPLASFGTFEIEGQHVTLPDLDALLRRDEGDPLESPNNPTRDLRTGETCAVSV